MEKAKGILNNFLEGYDQYPEIFTSSEQAGRLWPKTEGGDLNETAVG